MSKIFIVEDDPSIREILEIFLTSENFEVQSFESVTEFSKRDLNDLPDLYLFDVMLPDGSGIDLCNEMKKDSIHAKIPVIIMSAHAQIANFAHFCHPDAFISKPFDIDQMLETIEDVISKKKDLRHQSNY